VQSTTREDRTDASARAIAERYFTVPPQFFVALRLLVHRRAGLHALDEDTRLPGMWMAYSNPSGPEGADVTTRIGGLRCALHTAPWK
jgi:hypothetical protein